MCQFVAALYSKDWVGLQEKIKRARKYKSDQQCFSAQNITRIFGFTASMWLLLLSAHLCGHSSPPPFSILIAKKTTVQGREVLASTTKVIHSHHKSQQTRERESSRRPSGIGDARTITTKSLPHWIELDLTLVVSVGCRESMAIQLAVFCVEEEKN